MIYDAVIPICAKDRDCVDPTNTWMIPFVTPGVRTDTPTAVDPSIAPILMTLDKGVEMWWRWAALDVDLNGFDYYGFGDQKITCTRYVAPYNIFGDNTPVDHERLLAKPESHLFRGSETIIIGDDSLDIGVDIKIFPPRGTSYGEEVTTYDPAFPKLVDDAYQINEGFIPAAVSCVPVIIITIYLELEAGPELTNVITNYGPADVSYPCMFDGNPITLNNATGGVGGEIPDTDFSVTIAPVAWYPWNGTWDEATGARN